MVRTVGWIATLTAIFAVAAISNANAENSIPLSTIVTTAPQSGLQAFQDAFPIEGEQRKLFQQINAHSGGASNLFLIDATNKLDAVKASLSVLEGSHSAETPAPVNTADPKRGRFWLVAYLGVGPSQPTWWIVESVVIDGNVVRVSYHHPEANLVSRDIWRFYYWIPLGILAPGGYQLEFFDTKDKVVTLSRRVKVETHKHD